MAEQDLRTFLAAERKRLVSYVRRITLGDSTDAEDIVQDVVLRILERGTAAPPLDQLAAYTFAALRNRVIDLGRRQTMLSLDEQTDDDTTLLDTLEDADAGLLERLQSDEGREHLFRALWQLGDVERHVIVKHEFEGIPFKQLSVELGMPVGTLLSHKSRAVKKLRTLLVSRGEAS